MTAPGWYDAGCARDCSEQHTYAWGRCALGVPPEPTVSMSVVYTDPADGQRSIGFDTYTVQQLADLIEPALRNIKVRLGPNALAMLQRGEPVRLSGGEYADLARHAAHTIIHRHDNPEPAHDSGPREQQARPTHPDGTPYRYHEIVAEGWEYCDGCHTWTTATREQPHQCAQTHLHGPDAAHDGGPTVAEATADDRAWDVQQGGG